MAEIEGLDEFLETTGIAALLNRLSPQEAAKVRAQISDRLIKIRDNTPASERGGTKVVIAGVSVPLTKTVWPLTKLTAELILSSHDPTGLTWPVVGNDVLNTLDKLGDLIHKLDAVEIKICEAIKAKRHENRKAGVKADGASSKDVENYYAEHNLSVPKGLSTKLEELVRKQVLVKSEDEQSEIFYRTSL